MDPAAASDEVSVDDCSIAIDRSQCFYLSIACAFASFARFGLLAPFAVGLDDDVTKKTV